MTSAEKRIVAGAASAPIVASALVLSTVAAVTGARAGEVAGASLVYGGLVGLAAAFVAIDRLQARQCPRCRRRRGRGRERCAGCGYDLATGPRFACDQRHELYLDAHGDGRCGCGARVHELPTARGVGREVAVTLKLGAWLLAFLLGVGLVLQVLERTS